MLGMRSNNPLHGIERKITCSSTWRLPFSRNFVEQPARLGRDMEITIVAERSPRS